MICGMFCFVLDFPGVILVPRNLVLLEALACFLFLK